jgi:CRISPR system Cascade subunit CasA
LENRFNLIVEPWIPVVDVGRVSLRDIFTHAEYRGVGGDPVQKIALTKFLLAIIQSAGTPVDMDEWLQWGWQGLASRTLEYLNKWHDRFFLYGNAPFLQMPAIVAAEIKPYGAVIPNVSTGNTTVLTQSQSEIILDDADKAVLIITLMGFALGGKKTDNHVVLTDGYQGKHNDKGKASTGKPGPSIAYMGLLHSFCQSDCLQKTLWLNTWCQSEIFASSLFPQGLGIAPWELMPDGEDCQVARQLKQSLMGRMVPLARFCLLSEAGLHYSEGIAHGNYKEGIFDPSIAINQTGKKIKVLWANPEKRPWRELTAFLSFLAQNQTSGFDCWQLRLSMAKALRLDTFFAIWSGGLSVSGNAGEQYVSGTDDFVESLFWLSPKQLGEIWFTRLKEEMTALDSLAKSLYGSVMGYFKAQTMEGDNHAAQATVIFWQLCEHQAQSLIDQCDNPQETQKLRATFARYVSIAYNQFCPNHTARQMDAWARCRPVLNHYLNKEGA